MLLRLAHLGLTNTFALLRLIPMSNQAKDIEILASRHQIGVLQRQLGDAKLRFSPADGLSMSSPNATAAGQRMPQGVSLAGLGCEGSSNLHITKGPGA